jgi:capsular polysaccharide transport system permease protein
VQSFSVTKTKRFSGANKLFMLTVGLPTALAILYFGLFASDVYVSESRFVVRSPDKPSTSGLGVLLKSAGFSNAGDEIFAAHEYVTSRDALKDLNRNNAFAHAYDNSSISIFDRFNPLGLNGSFEDLYDYYRGKVGIEYATTSSITTLTVRAYTAQDAQRFNRQLLERAENLVNRLNTRGRSDLVQFATQEVVEAKIAARDAALTLAQFRNARGILDPEKQATLQLQMVSKLQDELIGARTQLQQLRAIAPENPQIPILETRIGSLSKEIDEQLGLVAGDRGSLSATAAQYQRLELEREFMRGIEAIRLLNIAEISELPGRQDRRPPAVLPHEIGAVRHNQHRFVAPPLEQFELTLSLKTAVAHSDDLIDQVAIKIYGHRNCESQSSAHPG